MGAIGKSEDVKCTATFRIKDMYACLGMGYGKRWEREDGLK